MRKHCTTPLRGQSRTITLINLTPASSHTNGCVLIHPSSEDKSSSCSSHPVHFYTETDRCEDNETERERGIEKTRIEGKTKKRNRAR